MIPGTPILGTFTSGLDNLSPFRSSSDELDEDRLRPGMPGTPTFGTRPFTYGISGFPVLTATVAFTLGFDTDTPGLLFIPGIYTSGFFNFASKGFLDEPPNSGVSDLPVGSATFPASKVGVTD